MEREITTIAAISTPAGSGAIAIIRLSGPDALPIIQKAWKGKKIALIRPNTSHLGYVTAGDNSEIDQVVITVFHAPHSFTGEDTVEIACHGSAYIQKAILARLIDCGATPAGPGEFSMRAVMNGKLDLCSAEAVADLIASTSKAAADIAIRQMKGGISSTLSNLTDQLTELASLIELELDFSEEDVEFASRTKLLSLAEKIDNQLTRLIDSYTTGSALRNGIPIVIAGAPNAGKSSLLNALLSDDRAIVSEIPGTTRDTIEDTLNIGPYLFRITDTAGLRETSDPLEKAGISRTLKAIRQASILLTVIDSTLTPTAGFLPLLSNASEYNIILLNKTDLPQARPEEWQNLLNRQTGENRQNIETINISTRRSEDIDNLRNHLQEKAETLQNSAGEQIITGERHRLSLHNAHAALQRVIRNLTSDYPLDMLTQDIRETIHHLGQITGSTLTTPTLLSHIFTRFCVGK